MNSNLSWQRVLTLVSEMLLGFKIVAMITSPSPQVIQSQHLTESEVIFLELATLMTVLSFYRKLSCDGQPPMQGAFGSEQFCQHYA